MLDVDVDAEAEAEECDENERLEVGGDVGSGG